MLRYFGLFNLARDVFYRIAQDNTKFVNFYRQFIAKDDLCFDIGANIGQKTDIFLRLGASVIAVEPQKECFHYLQRKYKNNSRVTIVPKAVAETAGEKEFFVCEANALSTMSKDWISAQTKSGRFGEFSWDKKIMVPTTTLTDLIMQFGKPGFCKIDVEGGELDVITGLRQPLPVISIEITRESLPAIEKCIAHLDILGANLFNYCCWDTLEFAFPAWLSTDKLLKELYSLPADRLTGDLYVRSS